MPVVLWIKVALRQFPHFRLIPLANP